MWGSMEVIIKTIILKKPSLRRLREKKLLLLMLREKKIEKKTESKMTVRVLKKIRSKEKKGSVPLKQHPF